MSDRKDYFKKYQQEHKEQIRKNALNYYYKNIEKIREKRQTNEYKQKHREYQKKWLEDKDKEIGRLNSIIKEVRECINHYAIEDEDFSKIYNQEEQELLSILDKVEENTNGKD